MPKDTYIPRNEVIDINREFNKVRKQAEEELMSLPGVMAVGVGLKQVKGEMRRQPCFKITVRNKITDSELIPAHRIPDTLFGFKTDINQTTTSFSGANSSRYRPLVGGSQIQCNSSSFGGTLGCFAKRNSDNKIVLLSNWHVIVGRKDQIDEDRVGQPTHNGCCSCCASNEIAKVTDGRFLTDEIDAAIAVLNGQETGTIPDERFLNEILEIGALAGGTAPKPVPSGTTPPLALETVYKYGRTTGLTKGQIINDNATHSTIYEEFSGLEIERKFIVVIQPSPPFTDYFLKGDSGSVSVNEQNQVVSLNYGFTTLHFTFSHSIVRVSDTLGITILDSSFHAGSVGNEGVLLNSVNAVQHPSLMHSLAGLEAELSGSKEGLRILELFRIHRAELLDLVRHKREVMVAWNRYQGPAYLAHIAKNIRNENKPVPEQIKDINMQSLLLKMAAVLQRNGSPALAGSVSENYLKVMNILSAGRTPQEWRAYLQQLDTMKNA